ncbi:MAG TPA: NUDIX domain-containing protein [Candidatus Saccharimonadales bacterium]|nr:NUDIX domain-containing protein [Candidatus Saccharimonadales bacterium]
MVDHRVDPFAGAWGDARWEFVPSLEAPDAALCTTAAAVALWNFDTAKPHDPDSVQVVLTCNAEGRGTDSPRSWELPGGHIDPLDPNNPDGPMETPEQALARETLEEAGFVITKARLFGYRKVTNPAGSQYPELAYTPFYWAATTKPLQAPTEPGVEAEVFQLGEVRELLRTDEIQLSELAMVEYGVAAALRHRF